MQDCVGYKVVESKKENIQKGDIILGYSCYLDAYAATYSYLAIRWYYVDHRKQELDKMFRYTLSEIVLFDPVKAELKKVRLPSTAKGDLLANNQVKAQPFLSKQDLDTLLIKLSFTHDLSNLYNYDTFKVYLMQTLQKGVLEDTLQFYKQTIKNLWKSGTTSVFHLEFEDGKYRYSTTVSDEYSKWYTKRAENETEELARFFELYDNDF